MTETIEQFRSKVFDELRCRNKLRKLKKKNLTEENNEKLRCLKNKYKDKRCFIVGSSPSLNLLDLTKLNNEYVFTVNRGYMLKEKGLLHSNFHVISDKRVFEDENSQSSLIDGFTSLLFCTAEAEPNLKTETYYFERNTQDEANGLILQEDITKPLIEHATVICYAIQIASYLGFKDIYIIGVDLDFQKTQGHCYNETPGERERQQEESLINRNMMLEAIEAFSKLLIKRNIKLYNASPSGILDCIERVKYEGLFE